MSNPQARSATAFRKLLLATCFLALGIGSPLGCGGSASPSSADGGSTQKNCSEKHTCVNGSCKCDSGANKDATCCDPSDSSCSDSSSRCDKYCEVCQ